MKGSTLSFLSILSFVSFAHGALIGYQRIPEDFTDPIPQTKAKEVQTVPNNLYFDGLLSLIWLSTTRQKLNILPKMVNEEIEVNDQKDLSGLGHKIWKELTRRIT